MPAIIADPKPVIAKTLLGDTNKAIPINGKRPKNEIVSRLAVVLISIRCYESTEFNIYNLKIKKMDSKVRIILNNYKPKAVF